MKKFMKKLAKKTEGFTLVELIVVIAILGILAGVAVPAYSGYLSKAKEAGDITSLSAIKTAAVASQAKVGSVDKITVDVNNAGEVSSVVINVSGRVVDDESEGAAEGATVPEDIVLYTDNGTTVDWKNPDFKTFLNEAMPGPLESAKFASGAEWTGDDWAAPTADET